MKQSDRRKQSTEKLIQACLELAAEKGVSALTFDNIGEKAGYSRNLAFQKFGSKAGLLEAVINYLHDVMTDTRERRDLEKLNGLDALRLYCDVHISAQERAPDMRAYFILMSEAVSEQSEMRALFVRSHERSVTEIRRLIKRGRADGSIRKDINVEMAALLIGTQLIGISSEALIDPQFSLRKARKELRFLISAAYGAGVTEKSRSTIQAVAGR